MLVVDARNGKVTVDVPLGALGASVQSLVVSPDRQRMYVRCFDAGGRQQLVIIDVAAGKRLASLSLGSLSQQLESDDLVHEGDVLPLAVGDFSRQLGNNGNVERLTPNSTILFLRKSDGKVLKGLQLPQTSQDIRFPMHRAAKVRGSVLLVHSSWGVVAFGHDPNGKPPQIEE